MHYNNQIKPTVEAEAAGSIWELEGEEDEQKINIPPNSSSSPGAPRRPDAVTGEDLGRWAALTSALNLKC